MGSRRDSRTDEVLTLRLCLAQHLAVQEDERVQRLVLGGGCNVFCAGEVSQKPCYLRTAEHRRMALAVEQNEAANPVDVNRFGTRAVVPEPDLSADAVEQARRLPLLHAPVL